MVKWRILQYKALAISRRFVVLAVSAALSFAAPLVPAFAQYHDFPSRPITIVVPTWFGIVGPAGIPAPVVKRLNGEFIRAARSEAVTHMLVSQATEVFTSTPQEFSALMARDIVRLGKVVRESGAKGE